ncbi:MAG: DNA-binding response regulator [Rhizobacter sp.]|nr:DNA-binding response regulator [Rhizobacter sp.]
MSTPTDTLPKLLLIEDDAAIGKQLSFALKQAGYDVTLAPTGEDGLRLARAGRFDGGLFDLGLPDRDGIELLIEMRSEGHSFPILIITARDHVDDRVRGLDAGADDYLVKPFALSELEARVRALLRRNEDQVPWRQLGALRFNLSSARAMAGDNEIELTRREWAVLAALSRRLGRVVPKEALFAAVFPHDTESAANAIEVQVSRLRRKLEAAGVTIRALRGLGYRLEKVDVPPDAGEAS